MLNADNLHRHSLDARQFIDFRQSTLANGMRIVDAYNASGLHLTILPDRGLDIWTAHYKGLPLTWISQGSPHPSDFGQTWLQRFNGGLLTTCGMSHVGPSETDAITGEARDLHGRYSRLRASAVSVYVGDQQATLRGVVSEQRLFGEQLRLERSYTLTVGEPAIHLSDTIANLSDEPAPLMLLYHINVGYPLVRAGARLHTPYQAVFSRDAEARRGYERWPDYGAAETGFREQVYFHQVRHDTAGRSRALLQNSDFGFLVDWDTTAMPYLTQWKNTRQGIYVSGIEPGNCLPEGLNAARQHSRVQMLAPGESLTTECRLSVIEGTEAIQREIAALDDLRQHGTATTIHLDDYGA